MRINKRVMNLQSPAEIVEPIAGRAELGAKVKELRTKGPARMPTKTLR